MEPCFRLLVALYRELEQREPGVGMRTEEYLELQERLRELVADERNGRVLVLLRGPEPVGLFAVLRGLPEYYRLRNQALLSWAYVAPEHRSRHGLRGALMVRGLVRWARSQGYGSLVSVTEIRNQESGRLLGALGFRPVRLEWRKEL